MSERSGEARRMAGTMRLGAVSLDCADPPALAKFYADLIGVEVPFSTDTFAAFKLDALWIAMHRIEDYRPPQWPNPDAPQQLHIDLAVDEDLDTAEANAISMGAIKADVQPSPDKWRVMIDPAGHPFCLCPASSFP
jgi:hypothetical protein